MADLNLDDLAVFVRVVEHGGFAGAARALGVPTSTVSRAIERLEARAGVRLLHRTTRNVRPTSEGRDLHASVAPAVSTLRAAAQALEPATRQPRGRLRVTAAGDLCANFLADAVVAFAERHPLVQLDFAVSSKHENLVEGGFDVAVRATIDLADSSLVACKLGTLEHRLYASPRYLQRHGAPASFRDLEAHHLVVFRAKDLARTWTFRNAAGDASVPVRGRIGGDDFTFVRAMVVAGGGIGLLPHVNCAADEASGRLVRVLPDCHARGATLYVVYPSAKNVPARVTAFRDFVVTAFASWAASRDVQIPQRT
ncbi:Transcriptional regulator, LysR family protein [Minicystis rosea]|nr:Transcriptional regulator, LysR family protein [Minicystis rosea]